MLLVWLIDRYLVFIRWMLANHWVGGKVAMPIILELRYQRERIMANVSHS